MVLIYRIREAINNFYNMLTLTGDFGLLLSNHYAAKILPPSKDFDPFVKDLVKVLIDVAG